MHKLVNFLNMSTSDRLLLIAAFILLNLIRLGLFLFPFSLLLKIVEAMSNFFSKARTKQVEIKQIIHAVHTSNYYVFGNSKCLAKALTTQTLMKIYGYSSKLIIGVAKENEIDLQAHAWVEYHGKVVIGGLRNLDTFTPLTSI